MDPMDFFNSDTFRQVDLYKNVGIQEVSGLLAIISGIYQLYYLYHDPLENDSRFKQSLTSFLDADDQIGHSKSTITKALFNITSGIGSIVLSENPLIPLGSNALLMPAAAFLALAQTINSVINLYKAYHETTFSAWLEQQVKEIAILQQDEMTFRGPSDAPYLFLRSRGPLKEKKLIQLKEEIATRCRYRWNKAKSEKEKKAIRDEYFTLIDKYHLREDEKEFHQSCFEPYSNYDDKIKNEEEEKRLAKLHAEKTQPRYKAALFRTFISALSTGTTITSSLITLGFVAAGALTLLNPITTSLAVFAVLLSLSYYAYHVYTAEPELNARYVLKSDNDKPEYNDEEEKEKKEEKREPDSESEDDTLLKGKQTEGYQITSTNSQSIFYINSFFHHPTATEKNPTEENKLLETQLAQNCAQTHSQAEQANKRSAKMSVLQSIAYALRI